MATLLASPSDLDGGDAAPLWFKPEKFLEQNFNSEAYVNDLKRYVRSSMVNCVIDDGDGVSRCDDHGCIDSCFYLFPRHRCRWRRSTLSWLPMLKLCAPVL